MKFKAWKNAIANESSALKGFVLDALLRFFRPAPHAARITDPEKIDQQYKYWRWRIFYSIFVGYTLFYFTRKSFTFAMPGLMDDLGYKASDLGFLGSMLYITYGISKFVSGVMSDRANPRYFMAIGLILTGLLNVLFGLSSSFLLFAVFWGLNGWFQGWGWPACTKQLTYWWGRRERGKWWSLHSTSHNLGGAIVAILVAAVVTQFNWRWGMFVPAAICIVAGVWLLDRLRDIPVSLGLPPIHVYANEPPPDETRELTFREIVATVFRNKGVWLLALTNFFVYIIRTGLNDWGMLYLIKAKGLSQIAAASSITFFEVGGLLGILVAGWGSDFLFGGRRVPYMVVAAFCMIAMVPVLWYVPHGNVWGHHSAMGMMGFLVFGPQVLVGLAASEFVTPQATCSANGFAGCFAYIGAAATGYPLGSIIDSYGWQGLFGALIVGAVAICIVLFPLWLDKSGSLIGRQSIGDMDTLARPSAA